MNQKSFSKLSKRFWYFAIGIGFASALLVTLALAVISGHVQNRDASIIVQVLGIIATFAFILTTLFTVEQNRQTLAELQKDKEKPLITEELEKIVSTSKGRLKTNGETLEGGNIGWGYRDELDLNDPLQRPILATPVRNDTNLSLARVTGQREVDSLVLRRFSKRHPKLVSDLEEYSRMIRSLNNRSNTLAEKTHEDVSEYRSSSINGFEEPEVPSTYTIQAFIINSKDVNSVNKRYREYLFENKTQYRRIMEEVGQEEIREFRELQNHLLEESQRLYNELEDLEVEYQIEYGLAKDEYTG